MRFLKRFQNNKSSILLPGNRPPLLLAIILALQFACKRQESLLENFDHKAPRVLQAKEFKIPAENISQQVVTPIAAVKSVSAGKPDIITLKSNVFPAKPDSIITPGVPKIIIPGKDGIKLPFSVIAKDSPFRAGPPEVVEVKDFYAKDRNPESFSTIKAMHGLPNNSFNALYQDKAGNLWIGTWGATGALSKYDGRSIHNYSTAQGLSNSNVLCVFEDKDDNIWIGTAGGGVNKFDGKSFTWYKEGQGLSNNNVKMGLKAKNGDLWFATDNGLNRFSRDTFTQYTKEQGLPNHMIMDLEGLFQDKKGNLWFCGHRGLAMFDGHKFYDYTEAFGFSDNRGVIRRIAEDRFGNLWFVRPGVGIYRYDSARLSLFNTKSGLSSKRILDLIADKTGNLWISTSDKGLDKYDGYSITHYGLDQGLSSESIWWVLADRNDNIWLATEAGVSKHDGKRFSHIQDFERLNNEGINCIEADRKGNIWVGTDNGIYRYDGITLAHFTTEHGLSANSINCIREDQQGKIWISTHNYGIDKYDGTSFTNYKEQNGLISNNIYFILPDRKGYIWVCTNKGISQFDGKSFKNYSFKQGSGSEIVYCSFQDRQGNVWFGTSRNGLYQFDGNKFYHYNIADSLVDTRVICITEDKNNNLWLGTSEGVLKFDQKSFIWFTMEQGLSNNVVRNIVEDRQGNIWVCTSNGLNRLMTTSSVDTKIEKKATPFFRKYTISEGFLGVGSFNKSFVEDKEGSLWIGSWDRLTKYHPEGDLTDIYAPTIRLNGIKLFNEKISWYHLENKKDSNLVLNNGVTLKNFSFSNLSPFYDQPENLKLSYDNNYITFQFIGITINRPKEVQYKYFLEGLDEKWSALTNQPEATYNNLPPGKFTFKVKAMNSDGYWSKELNYPFRIIPPWWKTWWAYLLYGISVVLAIYGIIRWRIHQKFRLQLERSAKEVQIAEMKQKNAEMQQQAAELEMQALRAQMNPHFIFNSLNSINRFILQNDREQASDYLTKFSKLVRLILENSQSTLISLENEMEALRLYIELEALRFGNRFGYRISVPDDLDIQSLKVPPLIIQPYVENAIWHGLMPKTEGGHLEIELGQANDHLVFRIADDGIGRNAAAAIAAKSRNKHKSIGLKITAERISMLQKSDGDESPVTINDLVHENGNAAGTEVIIRIPAVYE